MSVTGRAAAFDTIYREHAAFVWRSACRLGVPTSAAEDVMQDVFMIVHRRLDDFEPGTSMRAWLSAIVVRIVRVHWRLSQRGASSSQAQGKHVDPDDLADPRTPQPQKEPNATTRYANSTPFWPP